MHRGTQSVDQQLITEPPVNDLANRPTTKTPGGGKTTENLAKAEYRITQTFNSVPSRGNRNKD